MTDKYHIFISYSTHDIDLMLDIYQDLRTQGLRVWIDKQGIITGTANWRTTIQQAIENADCVVVLLSPYAKSSYWVQQEIGYAQLHNKQIFLVLLHGTPQQIVPFGFAESQWIDIRDHYQMLEAKLFPALAQYLKTTLPIAGIPSIRDLRKEVENIKDIGSKTHEQKQLAEIQESAKSENERSTKIDIDIEPYLIKLTNDVLQILPSPFATSFLGLKTHNYQSPAISISGIITNAQYKIFLDADDGYKNETWWDYSKSYAEVWRKENFISTSTATALADDKPCTDVTWYEAVAFCRWLSMKLRKIVTLPTLYYLRKISDNINSDVVSHEWCLNRRPQESNIDLDGNGARAIHTKKEDISRATPEFSSQTCGFRICIMDHHIPLTDIDLNMSGIKLDTKFRIDKSHKLWQALNKVGANLRGDENPFPVQIKDRLGYITFQVRRAYTEAGHLDLGGYTLRDAVGAGDSHPFWKEVGLSGVPLLWGSAAIVFYVESGVPHVILGMKHHETDNKVAAVFAGKATIPAGIVDVADFTDSEAKTLKDVLIIAAKREFREEINKELPSDASIVEVKICYELQRCKQQAFVFIQTSKPLEGNFGESELLGIRYVDVSKIIDGKLDNFLLSPEAIQGLELLNNILKR